MFWLKSGGSLSALLTYRFLLLLMSCAAQVVVVVAGDLVVVVASDESPKVRLPRFTVRNSLLSLPLCCAGTEDRICVQPLPPTQP